MESDGSSDDKVDSISVANSPAPIRERSHLVTEIFRLSIVQRADNSVYCTFTLPTVAMITSAIGETNKGETILPQHKIISPYGGSAGTAFDEKNSFPPGDYCLGFLFENKEVTDSVIGIKISLLMEPVTNLMISQVLFGLYRSLGFEPSHRLKYSVLSSAEELPFYRKVRHEIGQLSSKLDDLLSKLDRLNVRSEPTITLDQIKGALTSSNEEKGSAEQVIRLDDLQGLLDEKQKLYDKLTEAEDYIESMLHKRKH